jgi:hypothetical protein
VISDLWVVLIYRHACFLLLNSSMAAPHKRTFNGASVAPRTSSTNYLRMSATIITVQATPHLEYVTFAEIRVGKERCKLLTSPDWSVILGREARTKHLGKPTVIPNRDLVVRSVKAVDQTLDRVPIIVQDKSISR